MASAKAQLKAARTFLQQGQLQEAVDACDDVLQSNPASYEAHLLSGKALFGLGDAQRSTISYRRAAKLNEGGAPAWMGLAEVAESAGDGALAIEAYERLSAIFGQAADTGARAADCERKLLGWYEVAGRHADAAQRLRVAANQQETGSAERSTALCRLADAQEKLLPDATDEYAATLREIVEVAPPSAQFVQYHDALLQHLLVQTAGSGGARVEAASLCRRMCAGHCASPLAIVTVLQLAEEDAWGAGGGGGVASGRQRHAALGGLPQRFLHQFPGHPLAWAAHGLTLWGVLTSTEAPSTGAARTGVAEVLSHGLSGGEGLGSLWVALSALRLQTGEAQLALEAAAAGLSWLRARQEAGQQAMPGIAAALRLARVRALIPLGRLNDAAATLQRLQGVADECLVDPLSAAPARLAAERLRARAELDAARRDWAAVIAGLQEAVAASNAPYWAYGLRGWALVQAGDLDAARQHLEQAVSAAKATGPPATDHKLAELRLRLGTTYWELGGDWRSNRKHTHAQWLAAAAVAGPSQAAAFARLGDFYAQIAGDAPRARKCYQRALAVDPLQADAGNALCELLAAGGSADTAAALAAEIAAAQPAALWAVRRLAFDSMASSDAASAVPAFQKVLRADAADAAAWEGLAAAYQALGRFTAALKAFGRAGELQPSRLLPRVQAGLIQTALGDAAAAEASFGAALDLDPRHAAALTGLAAALLASARAAAAQGAPGIAAAALAQAAEVAARCAAAHGNMATAWKLAGDARLQHHGVTPAAARDAEPAERWQTQIDAMAAARRAYAKALHLRPGLGAAWEDLAAGYYHEAQLRRAAPQLQPQRAQGLHATAERLIRGGLRLAPSAAQLWAALGCVAASAPTREAALARSLQLEPRSAFAWTALGRLYAEQGGAEGRDLAASCFLQARGHDPMYARVWEAMSAMAGNNATGLHEKMQAAEFAARLPAATTEASLGYVEGSVHFKMALDGGAYAAACRSAEAEPLNAAAQNARGLAAESRGDFAAAQAAYGAAAQLLQSSSRGWAEQGPGRPLTHFDAPHDYTWRNAQSAELNAARAAARAGDTGTAAAVYGGLQAEGAIQDPWARLAHAAALAAAGDVDAAGAVLAAALQTFHVADKSEARVATLRAACQLAVARGRPQDGLQLLYGALPVVAAGAAEGVPALVLTVLAGVLTSQDEGVAGQAHALLEWLRDSPAWSAQLHAEAQLLWAAADAACGAAKHQAAGRLQAALHVAPWSLRVRSAAARALADAGPAAAAAAARLWPTRPPQRAIVGDAFGHAARDAQRARVGGALAAAGGTSIGGLTAELQALTSAVHAQPWDAQLPVLAALVSAQLAAGRPAARLCRAAEVLCSAALAAVQRVGAPAASDAEAALQAAEAGSSLQQAARRQVARCHEAASDAEPAVAAYVQAAQDGDPAAAAAAVRLLGRGSHVAAGAFVAEVAPALERRLAPEFGASHLAALHLRAALLQESGDSEQAQLHLRQAQQHTSSHIGGADTSSIGAGPLALLPRLVAARLDTAQAAAGGDDAAAGGAAAQARRHAKAVLAAGELPAARLLAARAEALGNARNKARHNLWAASEIAAACCGLGALTQRPALAARGLHMQPWRPQLWADLAAACA